MNKIIGKINALIFSALMIVSGTAAVTGVFNTNCLTAVAADDTIILRVCNWEEYIDTGDWSDDDIIDLESGSIKGENSIITDFENWYYENYGKKVKVQYSCLGTNEELYNMLTLGDDYDVGCGYESTGINYQLYIDGVKELRELNMEANCGFEVAHPEERKSGCNMI